MNFEKYFSIPYKKYGRDYSGCDCYGFVRLILKEEKGIELPFFDYRQDAENVDKSQFKQVFKPGNFDVVLLSGGPFSEAHVGLFFDNKIVHMSYSGACSISFFKTSKYVVAIYRV